LRSERDLRREVISEVQALQMQLAELTQELAGMDDRVLDGMAG